MGRVTPAMLEQLLAVFETEEFEHEGEIRLINAAIFDARIAFQFKVDFGAHSERKAEQWQIVCLDPINYRLLSEDWEEGEFDILNDHPLLWEHKWPQRELHLKGKPTDAVRTAWLLYQRHQKIVNGWISFPFQSGGLPDFLEGGYGILAKGSIPLLKEYEAVLAEQGVETYYYPALPANNSGGEVEEKIPGKLSVFIYGPSYVVAPDFRVTKVSERDAPCD